MQALHSLTGCGGALDGHAYMISAPYNSGGDGGLLSLYLYVHQQLSPNEPNHLLNSKVRRWDMRGKRSAKVP